MSDARAQLVSSFLGGADPLALAMQSRGQGGGASVPAPAPAPARRGGRTIVVGDSLGVGTTPYLKTAGKDTQVGRSSARTVDALKRLIGGGADQIVFDAGTNDATAAQLAQSLRRLRRIAGGATIIVPTVNGPDAGAKNALIQKLGARGEIRVVDWASNSRGLVGGDGIHASPQGYQRRAQMINDALS